MRWLSARQGYEGVPQNTGLPEWLTWTEKGGKVMRTLIKHGLIVDPASHVHSKNNLLVEDGRIQG